MSPDLSRDATTDPPDGLDLRVVESRLPGRRPAVLVLPGGGYGHHADHEAGPVAHWLAGLGIHAIVLRYPVAPARHPAPLDAARRTLAWIRAASGPVDADPDRVGVLGFSAGGHLAASVAQQADPPSLSILAYPVISFLDEPHEGSVEALLGPDADVRRRAEHSVDRHVSPRTPPAFVWHTADDASVPVGHSLRYCAALAAHGVAFELHVFPSGRHGLGLGTTASYVARWTALCEAWLASRGWLPEVRAADAATDR